jgi:hypothetical protein
MKENEAKTSSEENNTGSDPDDDSLATLYQPTQDPKVDKVPWSASRLIASRRACERYCSLPRTGSLRCGNRRRGTPHSPFHPSADSHEALSDPLPCVVGLHAVSLTRSCWRRLISQQPLDGYHVTWLPTDRRLSFRCLFCRHY